MASLKKRRRISKRWAGFSTLKLLKITSVEEDADLLNEMLDWWSKPQYDHYGHWLEETVHMLQKSGITANTDYLDIEGKRVDAVYFHKPEEPYGFLSNWYLSDIEVDGQQFTSTEQYIMFRKCMILGDTDAAQQVMATNDPAEQQMIGQHAKCYNDAVWSGLCQVVAMRGLLAKFTQHDDLRQWLLSTGNAYLVECARTDRRWACGIGLKDDARHDITKWKGRNILGFALMEVRNQISQ